MIEHRGSRELASEAGPTRTGSRGPRTAMGVARIGVFALLMIAGGCKKTSAKNTPGSDVDLARGTLVAGHGLGSLVLGTTTLKQASATLGGAAQLSQSKHGAELDAPPLRFLFVTPEGGGDPVLHAIRAFDTARARYEGKTDLGIGIFASTDQMEAAYGEPQAVSRGVFGNVYYYTSGIVFAGAAPSRIPGGYDGPPLKPTSQAITEIEVTLPFDVLEAPEATQSGQAVYSTAPKTTLDVDLPD